jgi:hypothetical protein
MFAYSAYTLNQWMEAVHLSEMMLYFYQLTWFTSQKIIFMVTWDMGRKQPSKI